MTLVARITQRERTEYLRFPVVLPRPLSSMRGEGDEPYFYCEGRPCQMDWLGHDERVVMLTHRRAFDSEDLSLELEASNMVPLVRPFSGHQINVPKLMLEIDYGTQWVYRPVSTETEPRAQFYMPRHFSRGFFYDEAGLPRLAASVEADFFDGFTVLDVTVSNSVRTAQDASGEHVTGDVFYMSLMAERRSRDQVCIFQDDKQTQEQTAEAFYLVSSGARFMGIRRLLEFRFAIAERGREREADYAMSFADRPRVEGPWSYIEMGQWGPEKSNLADMGWGGFYRHGSTNYRGWDAVSVKSLAELSSLKSSIQNANTVMVARGETIAWEPGGLDIQVNMGHWQDPAWYGCLQRYSEGWNCRHSWMTNQRTGDWLWDSEVAAMQPNGQLPWLVKRTSGAEHRPGLSIPWSRDTGHPWNEGQSSEESYSNRYDDIDHAHSVRLLHPLKARFWNLGSRTAGHLMRGLAAHYQYDPTLYRPDGNSVPRLEARAVARPGGGDGSLGRQIGWPMHIMASAIGASDRAFARSQQEWVHRLTAAVGALTSHAGGNRRREGPNWSWASPPPNPVSPDRLCDQVFEMRYVAFGVHSLSMVLPVDTDWLAFELIAKGLHEGAKPLHDKFIAYGKTTPEETYFTELEQANSGSGNPHHGNLCHRAYTKLRSDDYRQNANLWAGLALHSPESEYIETVLRANAPHNWDAPQAHNNITLWWCLDMVALLQTRVRGSQDEAEEAPDHAGSDDGPAA